MAKKYDIKKLSEVGVQVPTKNGIDGGWKFNIDSLKMDKHKTWTLKIKKSSIHSRTG